MAIFCHARCENPACGNIETIGNEDDLPALGWITVTYGPDDEDKADFCCRPCAVVWLSSAECEDRLQQVAARDEEEPDE